MKSFIVRKSKNTHYEQFTCRIEEETLSNIRKIVYENNLISINMFINDCLKYALKNIQIKEK